MVAEGKACPGLLSCVPARSALARSTRSRGAAHEREGGGGAVAQAIERVARRRGCTTIRLEVHQTNHAAIARYRKQGYQEFRRHRRILRRRGDALRFHKNL